MMLAATLTLLVLAREPELPAASFAFIVGVNNSVDAELKPLRYADDDAARYAELFELLGAEVHVLARFDENTQRLSAAKTRLPTRAEWDTAVNELAASVARARERGQRTILYFAYAGHANRKGDVGYLTLEDARLTAADLRAQLVDRLGAEVTHFIIDACRSSFLVAGRGVGAGERTAVAGFSAPLALPGVGLLLSTSSGRESHEWEAFQAGVFSHEVRSGLLGAADVNADGAISYREMAAFIGRANEAIANEKYRPDVFARAPVHSDLMTQPGPALASRVDVAGALSAHFILEDSRGVRLADFHNSRGQRVRLLRPSGGGVLYLRVPEADLEYLLPEGSLVEVAALQPRRSTVRTRGAADDALAKTFALPFDAAVADAWRPTEVAVAAETAPRTGWAVALAGTGAVSLGFGIAGLLGARGLSTQTPASQLEASTLNQRIDLWNAVGVVGLSLGGGFVVGALIMWLWPDAPIELTPTANGATLHFE